MTTDELRLDDVQDPVLRRKLEAVLAKHYKRKPVFVPPEVDEYPKYVFARTNRGATYKEGSTVRVRNGLDEETRGGTIIGRLGRAFLVDVGDMTLVVHSPDDSWVPYVPQEQD